MAIKMKLFTVYPPTAQEIFDIAVSGVINQGRPSLSDSGSCSYRGTDGTKCAAGFLIPDDVYKPSMEGFSWSSLSTQNKFSHLYEFKDLISALQDCHDWRPKIYDNDDSVWSLDKFKQSAKKLSIEYDLKWNFA
jgi:hypothetical protein